MLNQQKKIGIALVLAAATLLIAAFLAVPFGAAPAVRTVLTVIGIVMLLVAVVFIMAPDQTIALMI